MRPTPPVSAAPTASPRCPAPHPDTDDRVPVAPRPTCQPRRPRRADSAALHCRAATRRLRTPWPGHYCADAMPPRCSTLCQAPLSLPRSLPLRLHAESTLQAPTPPLPVKMEPPSAKNFSQPTRRHLVRPCLSIAHSSPSSRHPPHRFSAAGAPTPRRTPSERHRRSPPPVSAPPSYFFPELTAASSPLGLPRAAGPSHPRR
jgi:hypothetical protein